MQIPFFSHAFLVSMVPFRALVLIFSSFLFTFVFTSLKFFQIMFTNMQEIPRMTFIAIVDQNSCLGWIHLIRWNMGVLGVLGLELRSLSFCVKKRNLLKINKKNNNKKSSNTIINSKQHKWHSCSILH